MIEIFRMLCTAWNHNTETTKNKNCLTKRTWYKSWFTQAVHAMQKSIRLQLDANKLLQKQTSLASLIKNMQITKQITMTITKHTANVPFM